jgi:hypothetical protein
MKQTNITLNLLITTKTHENKISLDKQINFKPRKKSANYKEKKKEKRKKKFYSYTHDHV